jgi:hypothetical protein
MTAVTTCLGASDDDEKNPDNYKLRVTGDWWFSQPSGSFGLRGSNNYINFKEDFGFGSYSTFTARLDYRFRWKHHLLFDISNIHNSRTVSLSRTIDFQGQTYLVGAQVAASIKSLNIAPGYQYDIIRRNQGFLGIEADFNLLNTEASLKAVGTAGGQIAGISSSKSFFAPLPAVGPIGRWYPMHGSNRLVVDGSLRGMSFFGYGNFLSARAQVGVGITKHLVAHAGYQLGSRLSIHGTNDQIAIDVTQKGPTAGIEYSFGELTEPIPKAQPSGVSQGDWHVDWVPVYLWFSGLKGSVGAGGYVAPVNAGFSNVISDLNIGLMSVLDVRRKRFGLLTDLLFISVSSDQKNTPAGISYSGFTANAKTFFVDPEGYFRVLDGDVLSVDATAGARFWRLDNNLNLFPATTSAPSVTVGQSQSWVDPVLGARFHVNLAKGWFGTLKGDAGGFGVGSQLTYQFYVGIGKEFKQKFSTVAGYRYLDVDYSNGGFLYDVHMSGPIVGFNVRFK